MSLRARPQLLVAALAAAALAGPTRAGVGGSTGQIVAAIRSTSQDAIIAELERTELLPCDACIAPVLALLEDERDDVREAAAWWFARRPVIAATLTDRAVADLAGADSTRARNAADLLGTLRDPVAIGALAAASARTDLAAAARQHAVRALGTIGSRGGAAAVAAAMADADADVRLEALAAWIAIRHQVAAPAAVALVADPDVRVRAKAAAVLGEVREATGRAALERRLADDPDPAVRRNAAWALGRIGDQASRAVLATAVFDPSPLVRMTAKAALRQLP